MSSKQLPDRPSAHDADVRMTDDPELESARKRVRDMQAASESEGVIAKGKRLWTEFRAEADERNKSMLEDIERGKRKLAEKQRQMEAKGAQAASTAPAEDLNGLPPLASSSRRSVGTTDNESSSELMTRALGGFNAAFPFVGVVAGYSTIELMQQQKAGFSIDLMTKGCFKGVARWLPVGFGAAVFYGVEYSLRKPLHLAVPQSVLEFPSKLMGTGADASAGAAKQGVGSKAAPPATAVADWRVPEDSANWLSKMLGGVVAGAAGSAIPFVRKWPGFRNPAGLAATLAACGAGALLMPEFEEIEERGSLMSLLR